MADEPKGGASKVGWIVGGGALLIGARVLFKVMRAASREDDVEIAKPDVAEQAAAIAAMDEFVPTSSDPAHPVKGTPRSKSGGGPGPYRFHVIIGPDGRAQGVDADGQVPPGILAATRRLQFEGGAGEVDVTWATPG